VVPHTRRTIFDAPGGVLAGAGAAAGGANETGTGSATRAGGDGRSSPGPGAIQYWDFRTLPR
jgi:hypothetical protein